MAATFPNSPGKCLEEKHWYAGFISERKAEGILTKIGQVGMFLVRASLLPDADYVLSVNSGHEIRHYNITMLSSAEYIINKYMFPSISEAVAFYTENRLDNVYLEEPDEPVISEIENISSTHIKMAPLSPNLAKPQVAPISPQNMYSPSEETNGNGSVLHSSSTQLNGNCNNTMSGEVLAASIPHNSYGRESFAESDANNEGHETELKKGELEEASEEANVVHPQHQRNKMDNLCTTNDRCTENTIEIVSSQEEQLMDNPLLSRTLSMSRSPHDSNAEHGLATDNFRRRCGTTGSIILRKKTKEEQLEELNHLPSIKKKCHILQQRMEGGYGDSDNYADGDKESPTAVLVIENQLASLQVDVDDDIPSTFRSSSPRQVKPEKSPRRHDQPIAPIVVSTTPDHRYVYINSDVTEPQPMPRSRRHDQPIAPIVVSPTPDHRCVYTNSDVTEPHPPPRQKPVIHKRREAPKKDCIADEVDSDMPPPPPLSTHPEVLAAKKKKATTLESSRPRGVLGEAGGDTEEQDDVFESLAIQDVTHPKSVSGVEAYQSDGQHSTTVQPQYSTMNTRREAGNKKRNFFRRK